MMPVLEVNDIFLNGVYPTSMLVTKTMRICDILGLIPRRRSALGYLVIMFITPCHASRSSDPVLRSVPAGFPSPDASLHFLSSGTSVSPSCSVAPSCVASCCSFGSFAMTFSKWLHSDSTGANSLPTDVTSSSERFSLLMFWRTASKLCIHCQLPHP
jgi:hypothetical protein